MANPPTSAAGSGRYDSNTLHVGDGTWDASKNDFLLPNLVGLNFATMRYNGMGNRFRDTMFYHDLVRAHGILAAITFLFIVPAAIFVLRFYWRDSRLAIRIHVWLQILTVLLSTVILVLGYFSVGPGRSLTNPHHGIGVAIYVLVLFQAIWGSLVRRWERKRTIWRVSVKRLLHQWVGRAVALLAIAQVPLGLTLYGSPKVLFILYTLWMFTLLVAYFILSHRYQGGGGDDYSSNYTGGRTDVTGDGRSRRGHGFLKPLAAGGLAAAAFGALSRRKSDRRADSRTRTDHSRHSSRHGSGSFVEEKLSDGGHGGQHTWRNRLLAGAATAGVLGLAKNFFGGRKQQDSDSGSYSASNVHSASRTDISRAEEGLAPTTPPSNRIRRTDHIATVPVAAASPSRHSRMRPRKSGGSIDSYESQNFQSPGRDKRKNHTARNTIAALGVAGYLKHKFDQRGRAKEDRRVEELREQEIAEERLARRNSQNRRYTGDGRTRRDESFTESEMTPLGGSTPGLSRHTLPRPAGGHHSSINVVNTGDHSLARPPPIGGGIIHDSSGSEGYVSGGGRRPGRGGRRGAADLAAVEDGRRRRSSVGSPPISIKMKMRNDGGRQHVTLRRLNPQEAAAAAASRARGSRAGSIGSVGASGDERWRRTEARERAEAAEMGGSQEQQHNFMTGRPPGPPPPIHSSSSIMDLPPPPPMPASQSALGFGSPGSGVYDTGESAAGSKADSNRRRRRAERARAEAARDGRGTRVEFE